METQTVDQERTVRAKRPAVRTGGKAAKTASTRSGRTVRAETFAGTQDPERTTHVIYAKDAKGNTVAKIVGPKNGRTAKLFIGKPRAFEAKPFKTASIATLKAMLLEGVKVPAKSKQK